LEVLPVDTVIDGEIVALDARGMPSFNLLQNYGSAGGRLCYYIFDVLVLSGNNVMNLPLRERRILLQGQVLPKMEEPIREAAERGGYVKKGEKSTPIVFWKIDRAEKPRADGEGMEEDRRFTFRYYNVFNLEQTTLAPAESTPFQPLDSCSASLL
jgi:hypothetical protein